MSDKKHKTIDELETLGDICVFMGHKEEFFPTQEITIEKVTDNLVKHRDIIHQLAEKCRNNEVYKEALEDGRVDEYKEKFNDCKDAREKVQHAWIMMLEKVVSSPMMVLRNFAVGLNLPVVDDFLQELTAETLKEK